MTLVDEVAVLLINIVKGTPRLNGLPPAKQLVPIEASPFPAHIIPRVWGINKPAILIVLSKGLFGPLCTLKINVPVFPLPNLIVV